MVRNTYIYPPAPSMRIISDIFAYTSAEMPQVQLDLDLRLPHAGGRRDRRPRAGVHARRRRRVRARRHGRRASTIDAFAPRLSFFWAIGMNFFMEVAKLRAGAPAVGEAGQGVRAEERQVAVAAHAQPDVGLVADRAGRLQQRDPHLRRGDGRDAGPHAVAAHQRARRGARAADRLLRPHRPQHPAVPAAGVGHVPGDRSVGRQLLRRAADLRARPQGMGAHRGGRGGRRHDQGDRGRHPEAARSRRLRPALRRGSTPAASR